MNYYDRAKELAEQTVAHRRYMHTNAEAGLDLPKTKAYVMEQLRSFGIEPKDCGYGVTATLGKGGKVLLLRADMDALPMEETPNCEFAATNGAMHSCGHDMHTAMLLGAAIILKSKESELGGTLKLVFQPSEEKRPGGARLLLPHLLEPPVPKAIFGQHVFPGLPVGQIGIRPGAFFASSDNIIFAVEGKGTHAAMPQLGSDPILAATALIQFYQTIITKFRNPLIPAVLSITSIHGGTANNVIPDRVEVMGTVRTHDNALRHRIFELIDEKSPAICDLYGCRFVPDMPWNGLPPLVNDPVLTKEVKKLAAGLPHLRQIVESEPLTLGEDFAIYLQELPGVFWTLGVRPPEAEEMCPLHNPGMAPDERAIRVGIDMLVATGLRFLKKG